MHRTLALGLIALAVAFRVITAVAGGGNDWLPNFAPIAAIALCGAIYLPRMWAVVVPIAALLASDLVLGLYYYAEFGSDVYEAGLLSRYAALIFIAAGGLAIRARWKTPHWLGVMGASVGGSFVFYVVTNTASWMSTPAYAKTLGGWIQAMTLGLPGFPPTYMFYRNTLVSDLTFTGIFLACMALGLHVSRMQQRSGGASVRDTAKVSAH